MAEMKVVSLVERKADSSVALSVGLMVVMMVRQKADLLVDLLELAKVDTMVGQLVEMNGLQRVALKASL